MRRTLACLAIVGGLIAASPLSAQDIDVTGEWMVTFQTPQGPQSFPVTLTQDGTTVAGRAVVMEGTEFEVTDGTLEGSELRFEFAMDLGTGPFTLIFTGTVEGDTIDGSVTAPTGQPIPFTAERQEG